MRDPNRGSVESILRVRRTSSFDLLQPGGRGVVGFPVDHSAAHLRGFDNERQFRLIFDTVPGLIFTLTAQGEMELVNRQVEQYFGRKLEELRDWTTSDAIHPEDLPHVLAAWKIAIDTGMPYAK